MAIFCRRYASPRLSHFPQEVGPHLIPDEERASRGAEGGRTVKGRPERGATWRGAARDETPAGREDRPFPLFEQQDLLTTHTVVQRRSFGPRGLEDRTESCAACMRPPPFETGSSLRPLPRTPVGLQPHESWPRPPAGGSCMHFF